MAYGHIPKAKAKESLFMGDLRNNRTVIDEFAQSIVDERKQLRIKRMSSLLVLAALVAGFGIAGQGFLSAANLIAILNQLAIPLVLAIGATFVIIIGGIDLSIEGLMGLTGTLTTLLLVNSKNDLNLGFGGILAMLAVGAGIGFLNGFIQVKTKIPSFLLTFGMSSIAMGVTLIIYKGTPIEVRDQVFLSLAKSSFLGIPVLTWIAFALLAIAYVIQEYTAFGRYIYAIGSNEMIPRNVGIDVDRIKIIVFAFSGLCIGLAGILGASRLAWGDVSIGVGNLFPAITAVVVGGTPLSGGKGGVINTLVGALIVTILNNGLILASVDPVIVKGVNGLIILAAVGFSFDRGKKNAELNK